MKRLIPAPDKTAARALGAAFVILAALAARALILVPESTMDAVGYALILVALITLAITCLTYRTRFDPAQAEPARHSRS